MLKEIVKNLEQKLLTKNDQCKPNNNDGLFHEHEYLFWIFEKSEQNEKDLKDMVEQLHEILNERSNESRQQINELIELARRNYEQIEILKKSQVNEGKMKDFIIVEIGSKTIELKDNQDILDDILKKINQENFTHKLDNSKLENEMCE